MARPRDTITGEEMKLADGVLQAWSHMEMTAPGALLVLRGLIAAALAEHYADGYTDGQLDAAEGGATL